MAVIAPVLDDTGGAGALGADGASCGAAPFGRIDSSIPSSRDGSLIRTATAVPRQT